MKTKIPSTNNASNPNTEQIQEGLQLLARLLAEGWLENQQQQEEQRCK